MPPLEVTPIRVLPARLIASPLRLPFNTTMCYQFTVSGEAGRECVIRTSANLVTWETVSTFITTTPASVITQPMSGTRRFYQAIIR